MAECPICGYVLAPFEEGCPRCARTGSRKRADRHAPVGPRHVAVIRRPIHKSWAAIAGMMLVGLALPIAAWKWRSSPATEQSGIPAERPVSGGPVVSGAQGGQLPATPESAAPMVGGDPTQGAPQNTASAAPLSMQPRVDSSGAQLEAGQVGITTYTSEKGFFPEAPEKLSQFMGVANSLDLSGPSGREQLVRAFVGIYGEEEAKNRGISFCAPNGVQYHWP